MNYDIQITADSSYVIDGKIHVDGTVTFSEIPKIVDEYKSLKKDFEVYTLVAMDKMLNLHGLVVRNFVCMEPSDIKVGATININGNVITMVSEHFLTLRVESKNKEGILRGQKGNGSGPYPNG